MAVGNNSQTVGKNLVNNKGRYADIATVQALTSLEPGDFVVIENVTGYDTNPLFNLSPELADGDFDPNAADYLAVWNGSTWEIIDQDTGGGQSLIDCIELTLISDDSTVQLFNAYFDTDSQEWVGSDGLTEVRYAAVAVENFNRCCCNGSGETLSLQTVTVQDTDRGNANLVYNAASWVPGVKVELGRAEINVTEAGPVKYTYSAQYRGGGNISDAFDGSVQLNFGVSFSDPIADPSMTSANRGMNGPIAFSADGGRSALADNPTTFHGLSPNVGPGLVTARLWFEPRTLNIWNSGVIDINQFDLLIYKDEVTLI